MKVTVAKVTLQNKNTPTVDVLIQLKNTSQKEIENITNILVSEGYRDFKIVNYIFFGVDRIIIT